MPTKTVAIIGSRGYPSYYGGFETLVRRLAPYLVDHGWDVVVYGSKNDLQKTSRHGVDQRVRSKQTWEISGKSASTLSRGISSTLDAYRLRPDVALVLNVANGLWLPLLRARGIPVALNVDGIEWERQKWGPAAKAVFRLGAAMSARDANTLIYDAYQIKDRWKDDYKVDGKYIPYGGERLYSDLPIVEGLTHRGYVLFVARFVPENTTPQFFSAVHEIRRFLDVVIVGSSGYGGELDQAAQGLSKAYEKVHWLGHVRDDEKLFSLWQHAAVYFHGHSVGGTNPALVQAMHCGAPTVARDTIYNKEVLSDLGEYVEPIPTRIAATIRKFVEEPADLDRIAALLSQRAQAHYSWDDVCAQYDETLTELLPNRLKTSPARPGDSCPSAEGEASG
jgi:glycosyltransferase involved in cell wall biosynthesis